MHEASIAFAILSKTAEALSRRFAAELDAGAPISCQPTPRVTGINVDIGEFRNVDPESLTFAFDSLRKDLPELEEACLKINFIEARAVCTKNHEYRPSPASFFACTTCGGGLETMLRGEELNITGIELHNPDRVQEAD
jgi:Zn finger protein HypA/HybF involved in hydrogenase expression